jgi:hypothetical protein
LPANNELSAPSCSNSGSNNFQISGISTETAQVKEMKRLKETDEQN